MFTRRDTVAQVVLEHSECAGVFQRHRIDFCCRGAVSIETAAKERAVDADGLVAELERAVAQRSGGKPQDMRTLSTPALVEHIVSTHHRYLREALPFVATLASKVSRVHGEHNPKLRVLDEVVQALLRALLPHLEDEEEVLFPALVADNADRAVLKAQLASMLDDHLVVAKLLDRMREATDDFTLPDWACSSYRTLFAELSQLESDTFVHVHLENHILLPRATDAPER